MANCSFAFHSSLVLLTSANSKPPTQTPKLKALQKLILSYFQNVIHILSQLTDNEMLQLAVTESAKIIPYIVSSRKAVKVYLKVLAVLEALSHSF
jgi:nucleolar complex protein 2